MIICFFLFRAGFTDNHDQCKPSFSVSSPPISLQIQNIFNVCVNLFTKEIVNTKKFGKTFMEDELNHHFGAPKHLAPSAIALMALP